MKTSEKTEDLIKALFQASKELKNPIANAENPFFGSDYTTLDYLIDHIKKVITKHGLFIVQSAKPFDKWVVVETRIYHESGQWLETKTGVPTGADAQKTGSAITYCRRYALTSFFSLANDKDDDANKASDQLKDMPKDIRDLFIKLGYAKGGNENEIIQKVTNACAVHNFKWNLIRKELQSRLGGKNEHNKN